MLMVFFVLKLYLASFFQKFWERHKNWTLKMLEQSEHQLKSIDHHLIYAVR